MTLVPPELPSTYSWGFVVGQIIHAIADTVNDVDRLPEARPATGVVKFEPLQKLRKVATYPPAIVVNETVTAALNDDGELVDENGEVGIWLVAGDYRVSFSVKDASIPAYSITVSDTHTTEAPCDLAVEAPYMPPDGVVVVGPDVYIRRVLLTSNLVVSTAGWPSEIPVTVVFTQDGAGGRSVTYSEEPIQVDDAPNAETITAWVWTGSRWWAASSAGSVPVATEPPAWTAGTTATTGTPDEDSVTVTLSSAKPAGLLEMRYGSGDVWRTSGFTLAGNVVTLTGLNASTAYAAPQFRVTNSIGSSAILTAQGFTTASPPPGWSTLLFDTFTAADGTLVEDRDPDVGPRWNTQDAGNRLRCQTGVARSMWENGGWGGGYLTVNTPIDIPKARVSFDYTFIEVGTHSNCNVTFHSGLNRNGPGFGVRVPSVGVPTGEVKGGYSWPSATVVTTPTAAAPLTGSVVVEMDYQNVTLIVNGVTVAAWTYQSLSGTPIGSVQSITLGLGGGMYEGNQVSKAMVDNVRIEELV